MLPNTFANLQMGIDKGLKKVFVVSGFNECNNFVFTECDSLKEAISCKEWFVNDNLKKIVIECFLRNK